LIEGDEEPPWEHRATPPGCLDARVFQQGTVWVSIYGQAHEIRDLSDEYLRRIVHYLIALAPVLEAAAWAAHHDVARFTAANGTRVGVALAQSNNGKRGLTWLRSTALYRSLVDEARRRPVDLGLPLE